MCDRSLGPGVSWLHGAMSPLRHSATDGQLCLHGAAANDCKECGTADLCDHLRPRRTCLHCVTLRSADGRAPCPHGHPSKARCALCLRAMPRGGAGSGTGDTLGGC